MPVTLGSRYSLNHQSFYQSTPRRPPAPPPPRLAQPAPRPVGTTLPTRQPPPPPPPNLNMPAGRASRGTTAHMLDVAQGPAYMRGASESAFVRLVACLLVAAPVTVQLKQEQDGHRSIQASLRCQCMMVQPRYCRFAAVPCANICLTQLCVNGPPPFSETRLLQVSNSHRPCRQSGPCPTKAFRRARRLAQYQQQPQQVPKGHSRSRRLSCSRSTLL